jgi:hypothetical protein
MRFQSLAMMAMAAVSFAASVQNSIADPMRISGPHIHENLSVYFVHGPSASGPVPLTLAEAMERGHVKVLETGNVNKLKIENLGDEAVFIQAGDIVKGGKQDRALTMSLVLVPHSGEVPLAAFCVEQGRWSSRGNEAVSSFASSAEAIPSREAKLAMRAPLPPATPRSSEQRRSRAGDEPAPSRQSLVWDTVGKMQKKFSQGVNAKVASPVSESSLQLALENDALNKRRSVYIDALKAAGESSDDIIGYAFVINGKLNSADIYASNGLFRKMWSKQLQSAATEAIGETSVNVDPVPSADTVKTFLSDAKRGTVRQAAPDTRDRLEIREGEKAVYFAASSAASAGWVHENYLAK